MASFNTWKRPDSDRFRLRLQLHNPVVDLKIVNRKRRAPPNYDASLLMMLPPEIHRMVFDHLDELDRIGLLLTCKYFTRVGFTTNTARHSIPLGKVLLRLNQGFSDRIPNRLKMCMKCGMMRPKDPSYWEPHRSGWNWRKLVPPKEHRRFADEVHAWSAGHSLNCPRCFGTFVAQGNLGIGEIPIYMDSANHPKY